MAVDSYHSKLPETKVHHNDDECTLGNNIQLENREAGTGGYPLCVRCENLQ